ncbi:hypothetical protein Q0601_00790 [Paracoccus onubensis]|uniref:hypothetical protein n=1 Tax=Paracoccus onubensis TaxID=1675788 RepID=UPI00273111C9|nr:hypothetical protein [Paracoccus onubensis]MDP0925698.1 hypothetical protein [Paracoccus onubensis]
MNDTPAPRRSNEAALRDFLLDLLVNMQVELLATEEGREKVCTAYEWQATQSHPAVASVLRQAAEMVRTK